MTEPNRLNKVCDPDSTFQVLTRSVDAYVVALCRHKAAQGNASGEYGDIAVIQYSRKNGATCFYQALMTGLRGQVKAPSRGGPPSWPWFTPSATASVGCGGCHDNGPFIRSPYLNQVKKDNPNIGDDNTLPGSDDPTFNSDSWPFAFVGQDFASWKAFKVEIAGNECIGCHRMGVNNLSARPCGVTGTGGTALDFGERATSPSEVSDLAPCDAHKNPPSAASPIWMPPFPVQVSFNQAHANSAKAIHDCALRLRDSAGLIKDPLPDSASCRITFFAGSYPPTTVGVFRPANTQFNQTTSGRWLLHDSNTPGNPDIDFPYGAPGDIPVVVGDWTGNGGATIGVFRPANTQFNQTTSGRWLLNSNTPGNPDIDFPYGAPGDIPVVGDWTGNGRTTIGVFRPANTQFNQTTSGRWLLRNSNTPGKPDTDFPYGAPGDIPVVGDWTANGRTTIGVFRPANSPFNQTTSGRWLLRNSNTPGNPDTDFDYGAPGDIPVVGPWSR